MKLLVIGATGQVGRTLAGWSGGEDVEIRALSSADLDITRAGKVQRVLRRAKPDYVINAAAYTSVDAAEDDAEACYAVNSDGTQNIAKACARLGYPLIHLSTDYVFDGKKAASYTEDDAVNPINVYGKSKLAGEEAIRQILTRYIILRVSWVFSEWRNNFVKTMVRLAAEKPELKIVADQVGAPTPAEDIARVILAIVYQLNCDAEAWGTYHYSGLETTNWFEFGKAVIAESAKYQNNCVEKIDETLTAVYGYRADRPLNSQLACNKILEDFGVKQRSWRSEMERVVQIYCEQGQP